MSVIATRVDGFEITHERPGIIDTPVLKRFLKTVDDLHSNICLATLTLVRDPQDGNKYSYMWIAKNNTIWNEKLFITDDDFLRSIVVPVPVTPFQISLQNDVLNSVLDLILVFKVKTIYMDWA